MSGQNHIPFFFIIGRPRSGTTLLRTLFDAHPNVCIPLESPIIKHLSDKYLKIEYWSKEQLLEFYEDCIHISKFNTWFVDSEKLKKDILAHKGSCTFKDLIQTVCLNYISFYEKSEIQIIGDKNPSYSTCTKKIFDIYTESKYIYLTRDPRDNILSVLKVDFEAPHIPLIAYRWRYAAKRIEKLIKKYPGSFYTIKYEDLVQDPELHLKDMSEFLGLEYNPKMLDFHKIKDEVYQHIDPDKFNVYHSSLFNPINPDKIYGWKSTMSNYKVQLTEAVLGKYIEKTGYERKFKFINPLIYLLIVPGVLYGRFSYFITIIIDLLPFNTRMKVRSKGSLLAKVYWKLYRMVN